MCVGALSRYPLLLSRLRSLGCFLALRSNLDEMGRKSLIRMPDDEKFMAWHRTHPALAPE